MSSGAFSLSKYEADDGTIHPIRIQPETIIANFNAAPTGATTSGIRAKVSGSRRTYGVHARLVRLTWTDPAQVPDGYKVGGTIALPILTAARYAAIKVGDATTYLGKGATVVGKTPEVSR